MKPVNPHDNYTLRVYRINDNGEEHVLTFGIEDWWINDGESYSTQEPSKSYIEPLEDSDLIVFERSELSELLQSASSLQKFVDVTFIRGNIASTERIY